MVESDFAQCEYIDANLRFVYFLDFYKNKKVIKFYYQGLDNAGKRFYKWYVYANIFTSMKMKDAIWEYINCTDPDDNARCLLALVDIKNKMI